jgi:hypothetical protein
MTQKTMKNKTLLLSLCSAALLLVALTASLSVAQYTGGGYDGEDASESPEYSFNSTAYTNATGVVLNGVKFE